MVKELTKNQQTDIESIGFGCLLKQGCTRLHRNVINWVWAHADQGGCIIKIGKASFQFSPKAIKMVLGFSDEGKEVITKGNDDAITSILSHYGGSNLKKIPLSLLKQRI